jgi:flagellar basal body-associated protein FliL
MNKKIINREENSVNKKSIIVPIAVGVVALSAGFFSGMRYQQSKGGMPPGGFGNMASGERPGMGSNIAPGGNGRGGGVSGEIISKDDQSITVKTSDGSTKVVYLSGSTTISENSQTDKSKLESGSQVIITGSSNTDGSVAATNIQIQPNKD